MSSELEIKFDKHWALFSRISSSRVPAPIPEYRFHGSRRWLFDRAWPDYKIAVELEGGVYSGGRHVRGKGFEGDCEKYNEAVKLGWKVYRFTTGMLKKDPLKCVNYVLTDLGIQK
ncbi:MAG TPA: hypothetical protein ENI67_04815 [Gammaproteobacteria bacterium]|nr:hypothetical protein [Gammaproteobacteria bacterium]